MSSKLKKVHKIAKWVNVVLLLIVVIIGVGEMIINSGRVFGGLFGVLLLAFVGLPLLGLLGLNCLTVMLIKCRLRTSAIVITICALVALIVHILSMDIISFVLLIALSVMAGIVWFLSIKKDGKIARYDRLLRLGILLTCCTILLVVLYLLNAFNNTESNENLCMIVSSSMLSIAFYILSLIKRRK